jgi:hypothetical protein
MMAIHIHLLRQMTDIDVSSHVVASILRASTALEFPHFRQWAVRYLEEMWSHKLEDLSAVRLDNAVETITLGRNYGVHGVLKRAYYAILRTDGLGHRDTYDAMDEDDEDDCLSMDPDDTPRLIRTRGEAE